MDTVSRERRALLYALISVVLWSTVATGFKLGLRELAPVQLLLLGCVVALVEVHELEADERIARRWSVNEISFVAVAADAKAGTGRQLGGHGMSDTDGARRKGEERNP